MIMAALGMKNMLRGCYGHLEELKKWAHENGCPWDENTPTYDIVALLAS
jgi:hypothetical protein